MKFNRLYNMLMEASKKGLVSLDPELIKKNKVRKEKDERPRIDPNTGKRNPELDSKTIELPGLEIRLSKLDKNGKFLISGTIAGDNTDMVYGEVEYPTKQDMDEAYESHNTIAEVLNYLNRHSSDFSSLNWANIIKAAKFAISKLSPDKIKQLDKDLEFSIGARAEQAGEEMAEEPGAPLAFPSSDQGEESSATPLALAASKQIKGTLL